MNPAGNQGVSGVGPARPSRCSVFEMYCSMRTIGLASLGGSLVFYDFIVFVFLTPVISKLFFPAAVASWLAMVQSFGIFAAGYLFRPLGGIVLGHFGDMFGRKRLFAFSILLMSTSTLGIAALPTYESIGIAAPLLLIVFRSLQGIAIGGEIPGAWTFVAEHMPRRHIGLACGLVCSGLTFGILLASCITAIVNSVFSPPEVEAFAWRIPFMIGGLFGLPAIYVRWWLKETPVFSRLIEGTTLVPELPLKTILRDHAKSVILSMLLTWVLSAGIMITALMTATLLQTSYGFSPQHALFATSVGTLFLILGTAGAGAIIDRIGAGNCLMGGSIFFALATFAFYSLAGRSVETLYTLYAIMGMAVGIVAAVPFVMVTAFPARVRVTGISFSYNISYAVFGGLTPMLLAWLVELNSMAPAYYLLFIAALAFAIGLYLRANGQILEPHSDDLRLGTWGPDRACDQGGRFDPRISSAAMNSPRS